MAKRTRKKPELVPAERMRLTPFTDVPAKLRDLAEKFERGEYAMGFGILVYMTPVGGVSWNELGATPHPVAIDGLLSLALRRRRDPA